MAKKGKDAHNKITKYEMERAQRIKQNQEKMNALGLKHLLTFLPKSANVERKRVSVQVDDDEYVPIIGEDDADDESSSSLNNEMARYKREESTPAVQHTGPSPSTHVGGDSLAQISSNVEAQLVGTPSTTASTSRRARGMTRGLGVRGLVEKHGKLPVRIAPEFCDPVGEHAGKLASQIGVQVRTNLSTTKAYSWKNVDSSEKEAIIQNVADQFDLQGESVLVNKSLNTKCGRLLSSHNSRLFSQYKKLVKDKGSTYAINHPPKNATREKWIELIDGKWSDKDWLEVSKRNAANRHGEGTVSKHIHRCGNKSLAVRVDEERRKNGGHIPNLAQLYYDTRFNSKTKQWVHPDCEHTHQEMLRVQDDHYSTLDAQPLTEEEISKMVLKPRSGYVKGLGMRPSSSLRTPASSSSAQYIQQLEGKIDELQDAKIKMEEKMDYIIQYLRSKGESDICGSGESLSTN